jgi:DNA primase
MWSNGFPAIALGGSNISEKQKQLIYRSPIKTLILATDNDRVGREIREKVFKMFVGYKEIHEISLPEGVKDVNDLSPEQLKTVANNDSKVKITIL